MIFGFGRNRSTSSRPDSILVPGAGAVTAKSPTAAA